VRRAIPHIGTALITLIVPLRALPASASDPSSSPLASQTAARSCATTTQRKSILTRDAAVEITDTLLCSPPSEVKLGIGNAAKAPGFAKPPIGGATRETPSPYVLTVSGVHPQTAEVGTRFTVSVIGSNFASASMLRLVVPPSSLNWMVSGGASPYGYNWHAGEDWAVRSSTLTAAVTLGSSGTYALSVRNTVDQSEQRLSSLSANTLFAFIDWDGKPVFVPADPDLPMWSSEPLRRREDRPFVVLNHSDSHGAYEVAAVLSGRRLRAITVRPLPSSLLDQFQGFHAHLSISRPPWASEEIDLDGAEKTLQTVVVHVGPFSDVTVLARKSVPLEPPAASSDSVDSTPSHVVATSPFPQGPSISALGIWPLRI
jgi:hypothetical protein